MDELALIRTAKMLYDDGSFANGICADGDVITCRIVWMTDQDVKAAKSAAGALIEKYEGLIHRIARHFWHKYRVRPIDDLLQMGRIAILRTIRTWSSTGGCTFFTHAFRWITQQCSRFFAGDSLIHVPTSMAIEDGVKMPQYKTRLGKKAQDVHNIGSFGHDNSDPFDFPDKERHAELECDEVDIVHRAISLLPPKYAAVIRGRFFAGKTLHEVAVDIGVTRERVRQIEMSAMEILRKQISRLLGKHVKMPTCRFCECPVDRIRMTMLCRSCYNLKRRKEALRRSGR